MEPFEVIRRRGHLFTEDPGFSKILTHSGPHDDYDVGRGPKRSLTARTDKQLTRRDMRMPVDLGRSRRTGLSRMTCAMCHAVNEEGVTHHAQGCPVIVFNDEGRPAPLRRRETTGPLASNETSADTGWH
jgi:hypothetical protein